MLISIHDRSLMRVAFIDNSKPKSLHFYNDSWDRYLAEATSTFEFSVSKTGHDKERFISIENYISFQYNNEDFLFSIMKIEENEKEFKIFTENLNLELLNETKKPIDITTSQNLVWYLNNDYLLLGTGLKLGVNELSDQTRKIKLESEQTALARLLSIVNQFDGELEFVTKLKQNGTLDSITLNVYQSYQETRQGVGTQRQDIILYYEKNIDTITRTVDKTGIYNAIRPVGKDGLTIASIDREIKNDDGIIEFYTHKNGVLYAPISRDMFPSQMSSTNQDRWSVKEYSADGTTNVETLFSLSFNELKKIAYPSVTYEISGFYDLRIGDTFQVNDSGFTPAMLLKMRVAQQKISFTQPQNNKTIVGNVKALESGISSDLLGRMKELADEVAPYRFEIVSDNGLTFKNSSGNTTLTARVFKGTKVDEVAVDSFEWMINGTAFGFGTKSQTVSAGQVNGTATVRYNAIIADEKVGGLEVTIQDISDGKNGDTGATGDGISKIDSKWQITSSSTKPSDAWTSTNWKTDLPVATPILKYLWQIDRTTFTSGKTSDVTTLSGVYGDTGTNGKDGKNGNDGQNGADAWTVVMSNENVTLPANAQGGVTSYANSNTTIGVTYGSGVDLTPVASGATLANNQFKVTTSASNITAGDQTVDTINKKINYAVASGMNATSGVVASITYTISICNSAGVTSTVTKIQNFSKAEKGITGDKGIDSYTYIRYSASSNGANMTSLPDADSQYIGTCTTTQATSPTTEANYVWAKFVGANGAKGDSTGITRSTTEPATRYTGMLWQYTGTVNLAVTGITALPSSLYVWTGSAWQLYLVKSTNLQVDNGFITNAMIGDAQIESAKIKSLDAAKVNANSLSAITAKLGDVTAGTYTSWNYSTSGSATNYLNGIYLYDGHLKNISIENTSTSDPDTPLVSKSYVIRGTDTFGGLIYFYQQNITTSDTPNNILKNASFWSAANQVGNISSSRKGDGTSQLFINSDEVILTGRTNQNTPWYKLSDRCSYKYMFNRVYISISVQGDGNSYIQFGNLPAGIRPVTDKWITLPATTASPSDDRHVQVRASDGAVILWLPTKNVNFAGECSYTL